MSDVESRLVRCFQTVFPELREAQVPLATQDSVKTWDSLHTLSLVTVIEDEFHIQLDLDRPADLVSFERLHAYRIVPLGGPDAASFRRA